MKGKITVIGLLAVILLSSVGFAYWRYFLHPAAHEECGICHRHINAKAEVVAEIGSKTRRVCCAHCAITEARQESKPLRLVSVTDYYSGQATDPRGAWFVEGSRVIACEHDAAPMDMSQHGSMQMEYDRCAPGAFAFTKRADADRFVAENGGVARTLDELLQEGGAQ